ncbi:MAG TPA: type II toxin-antitoxin system prevent-host-death family antitoxin [Anaerolineales bacterium]|nr:type II toxin-antitoxin system prevent-host-death family antitoxin [Anaerolineales bacterium]
MTTIGVKEAKSRFSELIRRAGRGEQIVITRYGVPVAVLAPVEPARAQSPQDLMAALKAFRAGRSLGGLSIRDLIAEGRATIRPQ